VSVLYSAIDAVRSVRLLPQGEPVLHVGSELKCTARGNPSPDLTFSPPVEGGDTRAGQDGGEVWKTMKVPSSWLDDKNHTVMCTAVNVLDAEKHQETASTTFKVVKAKTQGQCAVQWRF